MHVLKGKIARDLAAIEEQLDQALERAFGSGLGLSPRGDRFRPAVDVYQTADATVVRSELAGVDPADIRLIVDGEYLEISGKRSVQYERPPTRHLQMEIPQGAFQRVVRLPVRYDPDRITASLAAGVLTVTLPHRPRERSIPVGGGERERSGR